jgi:glycosyltransferase involved in cell wall biosynthesis
MSRILVLGSYAPSLKVFRSPMLREMVARGHKVLAAAPPKDGYDADAAMAAIGVTFIPIPFVRNRMTPAGDLLLVRKLRNLMRRTQTELLLAYTLKPNVFGAMAAPRDVRVALMMTGLGRVLLGSGSTTRIAVRLLRRATRRAERVFIQNPDDLESLRSAGVVEHLDRVTMIAGSGVDIEAYTPTPLPDRADILMLARLLRSKGVGEYLAAARLVKQECPDAIIRLAGMFETGNDAVDRSDIDLAVNCGDIEYLGHLNGTDAVRRAITNASLYALPSWHEGTPHSSLEAMAMGRPIVTTDVRGCRETVVPGCNGLLVPPRDPQALADAIIELCSDSDLRERMGVESRRIAVERFDATVVAADICDALSL